MTLLSFISPELKYTGVTLKNPYRTFLPTGITAIIGPNGAGKSALARIIEHGWNFMTNELAAPAGHRPAVRSIAFSDLHTLTGFKAEYYQQRYESMMNDEVPTVAQLLSDKMSSPLWRDMVTRLRLTDSLQKRANYLSSGELRKLLIANMVLENPDVLILDNPYIGLDAAAKAIVDEAMAEIAARGISILLLVCDTDDVPDSACALLPVKERVVYPLVERSPGQSIQALTSSLVDLFSYRPDMQQLHALAHRLRSTAADAGDVVMQMRGCCVSYGSRRLIDNVDWTVRRGECWALSGPNGSGKSTLLSLVNADNPQAYSNDISLFGRRRGTGESIWDVKKRIGYLSAELHLYFRDGGATVQGILERAVKDTPADFDPVTPAQRAAIDGWLRFFSISGLAGRRYRELSFGQQRLVLFIAAVVRTPELLILDEPLHGLDRGVKEGIVKVVEVLSAYGCTVIYVTHNPSELPTTVTHRKTLG